MWRCMPSMLKCQPAAVIVNISVFSWSQSSIYKKQPTDIRCCGNQFAIMSEVVNTLVIHGFNFDIVVHRLSVWDVIEQFEQMHNFLMYDHFSILIWQLANQPDTSLSGCKWFNHTLFFQVVGSWRILIITNKYWSMARDMNGPSIVKKQITSWRNWSHLPQIYHY